MQQSPAKQVLLKLSPWLDVISIALWGLLLLNYWLNRRLYLLIHPNYHPLVVVAGFFLLALAGWKGWELWRRSRSARPRLEVDHSPMLPKGWGSVILLVVALIGFLITPRAFASQTAMQRGVTDTLGNTQVQPQAFSGASKPEERNLIEWMRTIQTYPEPDAYTGQAVKLKGFAFHPENLPAQYFLITRFTITCCAADAYPVSLPVKLRQGDRRNYPVDQWFEVEGVMMTETLTDGHRQLVIDASSVRPVEEPDNPYDY